MSFQSLRADRPPPPLPLDIWLRAAIAAADALAKLHQNGIIHQNIRPHTLRVDPRTETVELTDAALGQDPEASALKLPIEALPYIAPEQTGRLEGAIDHRADLYSLGVVLYELRAGTLPFHAEDAIGWVHCHVARAPLPLAEAAAGTPAIVSEIIMRLLAKSPDERYQSALGLTHDLERCRSELAERGTIEPFPLGTRDVWDKLRAASRLYGRSAEIATLRGAIERVREAGGREVVLIAGASGIGKSALVLEGQRAPDGSRTPVLWGKFEQNKSDIPYATLGQAFQDLIRQLVALGDEELALVQHQLATALGDNGQLIVDLVPQLELVIGKQQPVEPLPGADAKHRFHLVFRSFLGVFATRIRPLVLFLDDLQWADFASLELMAHLATHPEVQNLLIIGAYRDNEVDRTHPLEVAIREIKSAGTQVTPIALGPLTQSALEELVLDLFRCERAEAYSLAALLWAKTNGNPFFAAQLLSALHQDQLIRFDARRWTWVWDLAELEARGITDDMVELVLGKLRRLPVEALDVLKLAACIGSEFSVQLLGTLWGKAPEEVRAALEPALAGGLLLQRLEGYKFLHDRVRESAYSLIQEEERAGLHLRLGWLLLERTPEAALDGVIFDVANQLNLGAAQVTALDERRRIAGLDLRAGRKAKAASAVRSAAAYFRTGLSLLPEDSWDADYALTFGLQREIAECEYIGGRFKEAEEVCAILVERAQTDADRAAVARLQIELATAQVDSPRAIRVALDCVRGFGLDLPSDPSEADVLSELDWLEATLRERSIEALVDLPLMKDTRMIAAGEVLVAIQAAASYIAPKLAELSGLRLVRLSITHGNMSASVHSYAHVGHILCFRLGKFRDGYSLCKVALELARRPGFGTYGTEAATFLSAHVLVWSRPMREALPLLRSGFQAARATGKLLFAAFQLIHLVMDLLAMGEPLEAVHETTRALFDFVTNSQLSYLVDNAVLFQRLIYSLQGESERFGSFTGADFDEETFEAHLKERSVPVIRCIYFVYKISARYVANEYREAQEVAEVLDEYIVGALYGMIEADGRFYSALTAAALYGDATEADRVKLRSRFSAHEAVLRTWAESCPENFACRHALVAAEIARVEGREAEAATLYDQAIRASREEGFVQIEGIACELASRFYQGRSFAILPAAYLREAQAAYARWGASGKVRQLMALHPDLLSERRSESSPTPRAGAEQIDTLTATKASEAISSEMAPEKLLATLMHILTEHAGAQRATLLLPSRDGLQVAAEITSDHSGVSVDIPRPRRAPAATAFPLSIAHYVRRTREKLILDSAMATGMFATDPYLIAAHPSSILCAPIVRRGEVAGILYLENRLTRGAFTPRRLALLEFLAAVSLENALLAADLARETAERTQTEQTLRKSEERLQRLVETVNVVPWEADRAVGRFTYVGPQVVRMLGYPAEAWLSPGFLDEHLHPDDRMTTLQHLGAPAKDSDFDFRMTAADGRTVWLHNVIGASDADGSSVFGGFLFDVTERKQVEATLREKLEIIEDQQNAIRKLSTPIIQVWEGVLTVPVLGVLDEERATQMMTVVLDAVAKNRARFAIIDLTGVDAVDTKTADHIMKIVRAVQLLGSRTIVVGIRPEVAQTIVAIGVDLSSIITLANLRDALVLCMRELQGASAARSPAPKR